MSGTTAPTPPQTISFNEIPYSWQVPGTYVEVRPNYSQAGLLPYPANVLIIGQMLASGNAQQNVPYPLVQALDAQAWFGAGSVAADMAAAFLAANPYTQVSIMVVGDAAGAVKAAGTLTIAGTATQAGTLALYVAGKRIATAVNVGDTAATVAGNVLASIQDVTGLPNALPVSAAVAADVVTLTALHGGTLGNQIDLRLNYQPGDLTPTGITATIVAMAGGATDPTITAALSAISDTWYTDIVMAWSDATNTSALEAALETRYNAMGKLDSHAYGAIAGTYGTLAADAATLNSRFRSILGVQNPLNPSWEWAAAFCGQASFNLANDPARQLRGLSLPGILAPAQGDRFTLVERENLLLDGITTFNVQVDGTVSLERAVTEYKTSALGVPDTAWHDIMVPKTMSRIRYDWAGYVTLTYPRNKLADDGTLAAEYDTSVVTPSRMKGSWASRSTLYEQQGWIENSGTTAAQSIFVRDQNDRNRLNARQQVQVIGNLMILAAALEFQV